MCWGDIADLPPPPAGPFAQVDASNRFTCGVRTDGSLLCWGAVDMFGLGYLDFPAGTFQAASAGFWHGCAIRTDASIVCWGANGSGQATPP